MTDAAIVEAVCARAPRTVLDVGCGEGWLARVLAARGLAVTGVDASAELVAAARQAGGGRFHQMDYASLAQGMPGRRFDAAVCNFSLLGEEATASLVRATPRLLGTGGVLLIQTLHPVTANGDAPYRDGWRDGSWAGCGAGFGAPAPWYFRTLESWIRLLDAAGLRLVSLREPVHPDSGRPVSVLLEASPGR